jgi:CRP-like cAMP-binding protein
MGIHVSEQAGLETQLSGEPISAIAATDRGSPRTKKIRRDRFMTTAYVYARPQVSTGVRQRSGCAQCHAHEFTFCHALAKATAMSGLRMLGPTPDVHTVAPRRIICREQDVLAHVPVICSGWAASAVMLSDGSRQILSFLLPGDLVSTALLFEPKPNCFVEAITKVTYRAFNRTDLKVAMFSDPDTAAQLAHLWIDEKRRADETIVDLGRRSASERIARLILGLVERLQNRNMTMGGAFEVEFPLRQHHIADATGLTPVHVSKLLSEFRRNGLIRLSERSLAILDLAGFRAVADVR